MFSIIALRRRARVDVVHNEDVFLKRLEFYVHRFDTSTQDLVRAHGDCDMRLVEKIHSVIEPVLGSEGTGKGGQAWHHNLDFFGDGVRSLEVDSTRFPSALIEPLHALLAGEHEQFCILCWYYRTFMDEPLQSLGALALFHSRFIMTQSLVNVLEHA